MRCTIAILILTAVSLGAQSARPGQQPPRDGPAQRQQAEEPTGAIAGHVVTADSGRAVKRARVIVTGPELPQGRAAQTDDQGAYVIEGLPAGRYSVRVSKAGFVNLSYGQRRPLQPGTPLQLGDKQELKGVDFRLPRGGVIAGRLFDEDGEPMPGAVVRVMEYQYLQGQRQLVPAGAAQTDDRGEFRAWGLMPGTYYVSATAPRAFGGPGGGAFANGAGGALAAFIGRGRGPGVPGDDEAVAYASTFYPGVPSVSDARAIAIGVSQQVQDVNFALQLVRTARIAGRVTSPDGSAVSSGNVSLAPEGAGAARGPGGMNFGGRIDWDGSFALANVPPGRYVLRARSEDSGAPQFAIQPLSVASDMTDLTVILAPAATLTGSVAFESSQQHLTGVDPTSVRIAAQAADQALPGPTPNARPDKDGNFTLPGVPGGTVMLRLGGVPREWTLKSVTLDGRDITDTPIDVRGGQQLSGVRVLFTDRVSEVSGTVTDTQGVPITELTVLAFPTDASLWRPQARQIVTARPDQNGRYVIRGLPAGEYYAAAVDPAEQGEWYEAAFLDAHRAGAMRFSLAEGENKPVDFKDVQR